MTEEAPSRTTAATTATARMPRAERREQLVRAAASVFRSGGFDGTSMDDVARAAGVTRLIVYRIFESKEALYQAVLDSVITDMFGRFEIRDHAAAVALGQGEAEPPETIAETLLQVARVQPDGFLLLWRHAANEPGFREYAGRFKEAANRYAEALLAGQVDDGLIRRWAAECLVSHMYESICLWLDHGDDGRDLEFLHLVNAGLRAMIAAWAAQAATPST